MERAKKLASDLVQEVLNSEVYREYMLAYEKVKQSPELLEKIAHFKDRHLDFQTRKLRDGFVPFEDERNVSKLYTDLLLNKTTGDFIEKEQAYLELIDDIFAVISKINIKL